MDEKILDKIKKLLALAGNNPNESEADAAMKKAAKFAEENGLSISDIDTETKEVKTKKDFIYLSEERDVLWMEKLAIIVSKSFECRHIWNPYVNAESYKKEFKLFFVGMKTDVDLCKWYTSHLMIQILMKRKKEFKKIADQITYSFGCVTTLENRMREMFIKTREEARSQETNALVVVKNQAVNASFNKEYPRRRAMRTKISQRGNYNLHAFSKGVEDGKKMRINREINN